MIKESARKRAKTTRERAELLIKPPSWGQMRRSRRNGR
jgi:hypothetical protein